VKIRFIYPRFHKLLEGHHELDALIAKHLLGNYTMPPSLAIPILAALTPAEHEIMLTDDNIGQPIDFNEQVDLVAISFFTPQAQRAYEIADTFRKNRTTVILGGIHPTMNPTEAALHGDAVCIGEVEPLWHAILSDVQRKCLKKTYRFEGAYNLGNMPFPRREIFSNNIYRWNAHLVLTTRGCPVNCDGCPVTAKEGTHVRLRPVDNIIHDIENMPYREFYFTDDTVMLPGKKYQNFLLKIMERSTNMDIKIFLASTMMMIPDPEFYKKLKAGGAASMYTVFGYDRNSMELFSKDCTPEQWRQAVDLVRMIEDAGIHFFASFGIGFDYHDVHTADKILQFTRDANIDCAEFYIPTPFPGTGFGKKVETQGRLLHRNYDLWNTGNVVFRPEHFTPEQLLDAYLMLWKEFFRDKEPEKTLKTFTVNK